jgi:hypothetical protein
VHSEDHQWNEPISDTDHQIAMNIHELGALPAGQIGAMGPQSKANEWFSRPLSWWDWVEHGAFEPTLLGV